MLKATILFFKNNSKFSNVIAGMQAVFREYEEWLGDEEMLEYVTRGFDRAEKKLEKCLLYEEALVKKWVNNIHPPPL